MSNLAISQGQRLIGYIKFELYDKDGNLKTRKKHNMIVPAAKNLILHESADKMIGMNDTVWGLLAKQGVSFAGYADSSDNGENGCKYVYNNGALTNVLLSLESDQVVGINNQTNFINLFDSTFTNADKVLGYANMSEAPAANGKEGSLDYQKGADIISTNVVSKKFKYPDGVATGTINAIAMMPFSTIQSPSGVAGDNDRFAPGFRLAKCLDRVNTRNPNFTSLSLKWCPPGVTGLTTDTEILSNYSSDNLNRHKINLTTGEVADTTATDDTMLMIDGTIEDYIIDGDYVYTLNRTGTTSSPTSSMKIYKISNKTLVQTVSLTTRNAYYQKFLMINGVLYINGICYGTSGNMLFKLKKGTSGYWNAIETSTDSYDGILTLPSGLNKYNVCFGNYADKYIMYIARNTGSAAKEWATGYIFTSLSDIVNTIEDCIPSLYQYDITLKGTGVKGVISVGLNRGARAADDTTDASYNCTLVTDLNGNRKVTEYMSKGIFYSVDKNWSNIVSIAVLQGGDVIEKGATDVLYVTYGYKIN